MTEPTQEMVAWAEAQLANPGDVLTTGRRPSGDRRGVQLAVSELRKRGWKITRATPDPTAPGEALYVREDGVHTSKPRKKSRVPVTSHPALGAQLRVTSVALRGRAVHALLEDDGRTWHVIIEEDIPT